jgi:hypothetical protein
LAVGFIIAQGGAGVFNRIAEATGSHQSKRTVEAGRVAPAPYGRSLVGG